MPIDFYYLPLSAPCRSVMLLAKAIGVHFNFKLINVLKNEQMKPEYLKMNPQHTVPTMNDNGFILWESRPMMEYLVSKYAKNDTLYPKDPKVKGIVDQMLYFDIDRVYGSIQNCYYPVLFGNADSVGEEDMKGLENACEILDTYLDGTEFLAGDNLTIADISISTNINMLECLDFDIGRYDNLAAWYNRCKQALEKFGFEEVHAPGSKVFSEMYRAKTQKSD